MPGYSPEEVRLLNNSARLRLAAHGIEVRDSRREGLTDEQRHSNDESNCQACRARIAQWTKPRTGSAWLEYASAGLVDHARSLMEI
jgi:hypothetical protein